MTVSRTEYNCTVPTNTDLAELSDADREEFADELLRRSVEEVGRDEEYPFYSLSWLRSLCQADANRSLVETGQAKDSLDWMEACERLLSGTPMPRRYRQAFQLRLQGLLYRQIGQRLGVSLDTARRWVIKAKARLAAAAVDLDQLRTESELIREVFDAESRRRGYVPSRHCRPGRERCAKTGTCAYRWYLAADL